MSKPQTQSLTRYISPVVSIGTKAREKAYDIARRKGWDAVTFGYRWLRGGKECILYAVQGRQDYRCLKGWDIGYAESICVPHDWDEWNQCRRCKSVLCG